MFSPELMRFLIKHNIEEYKAKEKEQIKFTENKIFRYAKYATIPIEIKE